MDDVGGVSWDEKLAVCLAIASSAHHGQVDKVGQPYIEHPVRVAERLDDPLAKMTALLHDVIEDCPEWSADRLLAQGVPPTVVAAVCALTKRDREGLGDYLRRVATDPLALRVKMADMADNTDPGRLARLREIDPDRADRLTAKYAAYVTILDGLV